MSKSIVILATLFAVGLSCVSRAGDIYVSGFNVGEVYGAGANPNDTVTGDVDNASSYWTGSGYNDGVSTVSQGLPVGPFTSATGSGQTYEFQPFNAGSDALRGGGTITVTPGDYSALYLLGTGGSGTGVANVTLNFLGGSSTTFAGGLANHDWGNSTTTIAVSAQRTRPNSDSIPSGGITDGTWNIFESKLTLSPSDELKTLVSITITPSGNGITNLYAVNGVPPVVPEPASLVLCGLGAVGLFVAARRRRRA